MPEQFEKTRKPENVSQGSRLNVFNLSIAAISRFEQHSHIKVAV
jgi:hypothetical protein